MLNIGAYDEDPIQEEGGDIRSQHQDNNIENKPSHEVATSEPSNNDNISNNHDNPSSTEATFSAGTTHTSTDDTQTQINHNAGTL